MYGVKFEQDAIQIQEGTKTELEENGYEVFDTKEETATRGINLEYRTLRKEFNAMSLEELDSERAKELERRIWGKPESNQDWDYIPGEHIERRKKALQ